MLALLLLTWRFWPDWFHGRRVAGPRSYSSGPAALSKQALRVARQFLTLGALNFLARK
jgi:hypothetical protein